jgi:hypothetical protein
VKPQDAGAVRLVQRYAEVIDADPTSLAKLGPPMLAALESLGMTPKGRAALLGKGGVPGASTGRSELDEFRARRRDARANGS